MSFIIALTAAWCRHGERTA